jgi:hypothetical protein
MRRQTALRAVCLLLVGVFVSLHLLSILSLFLGAIFRLPRLIFDSAYVHLRALPLGRSIGFLGSILIVYPGTLYSCHIGFLPSHIHVAAQPGRLPFGAGLSCCASSLRALPLSRPFGLPSLTFPHLAVLRAPRALLG